MALTIAFLGLALLFLRLDAQFAGFAQILVYVGAVAILIVFAILLTRGSGGTPKVYGVYAAKDLAHRPRHRRRYLRSPRLGHAARPLPWLPNEAAIPAVTVKDIGNALMSRYVLPLEIIAVLLTAAPRCRAS